MTWTLNGNPVGDLEYAGACPERSRRNADGRVMQKTGSLASIQLPSPVSGNTFNADNEMTAFNGATLSYDADGNLTGDGTNTYTWDARGHLATLAGTNVAAYEYDAFGRRTHNTLNGLMTRYLYDGPQPGRGVRRQQPSQRDGDDAYGAWHRRVFPALEFERDVELSHGYARFDGGTGGLQRGCVA